jgi:hypothetical protein
MVVFRVSAVALPHECKRCRESRADICSKRKEKNIIFVRHFNNGTMASDGGEQNEVPGAAFRSHRLVVPMHPCTMRKLVFRLLCCTLLSLHRLAVVDAFLCHLSRPHPMPASWTLSSQSGDEDLYNELDSRLNDIKIKKTRKQLEEAHTQSFLKRRPWKLPYEDARIWVQANLGADTEEEFIDLVENGNLKTPYIPKQPEKYYKGTREWISWEHFLTGCFDKRNPSSVKPCTGVFD